MVSGVGEQLETFFSDRVDDELRSVVAYTATRHDIVHVRDDVAAKYTDEQIGLAVDDARLESIGAPVYSSLYSEDHGELTCNVKCYEAVVELNFILDQGTGVAVAMEIEALGEATELVKTARDHAIDAWDEGEAY